MDFPSNTSELMRLLLPHERLIRTNPILHEAVRILAVGFQQGIAKRDPDYLMHEEAVLSVDVTDNMRAAYAVILEEISG